MNVSNNDDNIPNAPGFDLPSPKLISVGGNIDDIDSTSNNNIKLASYNNNNHASHRLSQTKTNDVRSTEFTKIRPIDSEARNVLLKRVEKFRNHEAETIILQVDLIAQLIKDYDKLSQDYEILAEKFENYEQQHRSTLTPEKLEEYIKIADKVIEMNDLWIRELDKKHETFEISRKSLVNTTMSDPGVQEEFGESQEILSTADKGNEILEDDVKARSECNGKAFADAIRSVKIDNEKQRGGGGSVSKKIHDHVDITENGHKQVVGGRNKVRSSEENFGIGSSRTDYATEGINSDTEIGKTIKLKNKTKGIVIEKEEKVNGTCDSKSDDNNSQTWSDQVEEYFDENKKCEKDCSFRDWEVSHQNDESNEGEHRYDREAKENKDDLDTRNKKDEDGWREYNGDVKENKSWRNERQGGGNRYRGRKDNEWKNGNNRRR